MINSRKKSGKGFTIKSYKIGYLENRFQPDGKSKKTKIHEPR